MTAKRKRHKPEFKAQVALEAYKGDKTINQLASEHEVAAVQVSQFEILQHSDLDSSKPHCAGLGMLLFNKNYQLYKEIVNDNESLPA